VVDNTAQYQGSYVVKYATVMNLTLKTKAWPLGRNVTISGSVQPAAGNLTVKVTFKPYNGSMVQKIVHTLANGTFFVSFAPNATGKWTIEAECLEDNTHFGSVGDTVEFSVVPESDFFGANSMYIYAGVGIMIVAVIAVVVVRRRRG
jgi:hypothetical protein